MDKLKEDKLAHGFSGTRILVLSAALELGRMPAVGEVLGLFYYGSDPRITDLVKRQRKAGISTLSMILAAKSSGVRLELNSHYMNLVREFTDYGLIEEATRITQFWAETQAISADDMVLVLYLLEFIKKYPGRGIPVTIDMLIAQRVAGQRSAVGVSPEQLNVNEVKALAGWSRPSRARWPTRSARSSACAPRSAASRSRPAARAARGAAAAAATSSRSPRATAVARWATWPTKEDGAFVRATRFGDSALTMPGCSKS